MIMPSTGCTSFPWKNLEEGALLFIWQAALLLEILQGPGLMLTFCFVSLGYTPSLLDLGHSPPHSLPALEKLSFLKPAARRPVGVRVCADTLAPPVTYPLSQAQILEGR